MRQVKNMHWGTFSKRIEGDFHRLLKQIWRLIIDQRKEKYDIISINPISKLILELYKKQQIEIKGNILEIIIIHDILVKKKDLAVVRQI